MARALEKRAEKIRKTSIAAEKIYNQFVCVSDELEESDAGTLNLPSCQSGKESSGNAAVHDVFMYRHGRILQS